MTDVIGLSNKIIFSFSGACEIGYTIGDRYIQIFKPKAITLVRSRYLKVKEFKNKPMAKENKHV
jgi:hypothetical protein